MKADLLLFRFPLSVFRFLGCLMGAGLVLASCQQQMADQPRHKPLAKSGFFSDGRSARPPVEGAVARGRLEADEHFYTGKVGGKDAGAFPIRVTRQTLRRGQERYNIYCAPCHDRTGGGQGMIVRRGFRAPPSYHTEKLRQAPAGHFFDVVTRGFGAMPDYAEQLSTADRWAIVAYIRALQLSQHAALADAPEAERRRLAEMKR
jgi:mono/diheme cytochrome c family protein